MLRSPTGRARALLILLAVIAASPTAAKPARWQVTVALRFSTATGAPFSARLALPPSTSGQHLGPVEVTARGLSNEVVATGPEPHVRLSGKLKGARRVAVRYTVERHRSSAPMPAIAPLLVPPAELVPYLSPSRLFQSRSLLARDFLATNVSPLLDTPGADIVQAILQASREHLDVASDGKTLALDVIRSGGGRRIGIERAFTTFLRAARIPARFVEGLNLDSATRRKRVFWTEVWDGREWWAVSASGNWIGRPPKGYIALTHNGQRMLVVHGKVTASYTVTVRADEGAP